MIYQYTVGLLTISLEDFQHRADHGFVTQDADMILVKSTHYFRLLLRGVAQLAGQLDRALAAVRAEDAVQSKTEKQVLRKYIRQLRRMIGRNQCSAAPRQAQAP